MRTHAALATRASAGRVEPARLGVRAAEATAAARLHEQPLRLGTARLGPIALDVELVAEGVRGHAGVRVRNASDAPVRVDAVLVGFRWTGHGLRALRFLRNGWQSWSLTEVRDLDADGEPPFPSGPWLRGMHHAQGAPPADRAGWHESHLVTVAGAAQDGPTCLVGVEECGTSFGVVYLRAAPGEVQIEVELRLDVVLAPGETRVLERIDVALGEEPSALLEDWAEAWGRRAGARGWRPALAGWCSWYTFFHDVSEQDVLRNLEALSAPGALPVELVQIDDGYQRAIGDWLDTNERFPRGLAPLAADIRDAGFVPGIWTAPFCVVPESAAFARHRDALLGGGDGAPLLGLLHPAWSAQGRVHVLDPSRDDVLRHLEDVFRSLVEMGFLYQKLDFLYTAALESRAHDQSIGRAERLRRGLDAVRRGAGEEVFLLGCGCPLGPAVGVVDAMRTGPDTAPSWDPDPAAAIPGIEQTLPSAHSALRSTLLRAWTHRRLWLNDPDCLLGRSRDSRLSAPERDAFAAVVAATAGLAVVSDDLPLLSPEDDARLRTALAVAQTVDATGVPGAARVSHLLGDTLPDSVRAVTHEGAHCALVNLGDAARATAFDPVAAAGGPLAGPPRTLLGAAVPGDGPVEVEAHGGSLVALERTTRLAVFCDFDGTFSVQDVGATLAVRHAGPLQPETWERYLRGEITPWDYNMEVLDGLALPLATLEEFLHSVDLDPGARDLLAWCDRRRVPFHILSDGFDWNLNRLQVIHDVRISYTANHLRYEHGRWRLRPGAPDAHCGCGTGTCKGTILESFRARRPDVTLVHVGNGRVSDTCGAIAADVAFAKDSLAPELERRGEPYEPYETLSDVVAQLEKILARVDPDPSRNAR